MENKRTIGFVCPKCHMPVITQKETFALCASATEIPCPCGKSTLKVEPLLREFRLSVPCGPCGQSHTAVVPEEAFLRRKAISLSCPAAGLDSCYIGDEDMVYAAMERLEEALDKVEAKRRRAEDEENPEPVEESPFLDPLVMEEVVGEVKDIAARGGISCTCGSKRFSLRIHYSSIELRCPDCGGSLRIPAATQNDIGDICCKQTLTIDRKR